MNESLIDCPEKDRTPKRPAALAALCVLTWVGSSLLIAFFGYLLLQLLTTPSDEDTALLWLLFINTVCCILSVIGCIDMWQLRRRGFFVYLVGQLVPVILTITAMFFGKMRLDKTTEFVTVLVLLWLIVPVGFVLLYATQLRFLNKRSTQTEKQPK